MLGNPPSSKSHPELRRRRSVEMYDRMEDRNWVVDQVSINGELYLTIDRTDYRILDSGVTEFDNRDKPIVSVGAHLSRELVILDPTSKYLQGIYRKLKHDIEGFSANDQNVQHILDYTINFVRDYLNPDISKLEPKVDKLCENPAYYMRTHKGKPLEYRENPVIALDTFIEEGVGMCRHHGLFISYLLNNLVLDRLLPPGNVYYHRDTVQSGGAHVWAIYKPLQAVDDNDIYNFYLVDSMWHKEAFNLKQWAPFFEEWGYGDRAIKYVIGRHNKPDIECVPYTKIDDRDWRIKEDFIYDLLDAKPEARRKYLNLQDSFGASDAIEAALKSTNKFKQHRHYKALLVDLNRVRDKSLYRSYYANVKEDDDRQQFVLGLLSKSEDQRNAMLDKQDIEDLRQLTNSLKAQMPGRKYLYQQFTTYAALLKEIENRIEIKALLERHYDDIHDANDRERFMVGLLVGKAKDRGEILDRQNLEDLNYMKVSLTSKDIYQHFETSKTVLAEIESRIEIKMLHAQHYHSIGNANSRKKFVTELLLCSPEKCNSILDSQNIIDLKHLKQAIVDRKNAHPDQHYDSYQYLIKDIDARIKLKTLLHNVSFDEIEDRGTRRQFLTGLLSCKSEEERSMILDKQDIASIKYLQRSLSRSPQFQDFNTYQSVMNEIDKRISLQLLNLTKTIILSGHLELKTGYLASFLVTPGKKIELSDDEDIRVPTSAKVIYNLINDIDVETADLKTLTTLIESIQVSASTAAAKDHKNRTENTRALLNILKEDYASPIELLGKLETLHKNLTTPAKTAEAQAHKKAVMKQG